MSYLVSRSQPVHVFANDRNMLYVCSRLALQPCSSKNLLSMLHRLAIHLSRFEFFIEHMEGSKNLFANILEILTRGSKGYKNTGVQKAEMFAVHYNDIFQASNDIKSVMMEDIAGKQESTHCQPRSRRTENVSTKNTTSFGYQMNQ